MGWTADGSSGQQDAEEHKSNLHHDNKIQVENESNGPLILREVQDES